MVIFLRNPLVYNYTFYCKFTTVYVGSAGGLYLSGCFNIIEKSHMSDFVAAFVWHPLSTLLVIARIIEGNSGTVYKIQNSTERRHHGNIFA
ncbi:hypothetical protein DMO52_22240 [Salmonella enterica subsp. enterica serovar Amager]|nr:hypothetical protein [Salmonella enterica subsp. enterica serovar Amager]EBV5220824.1 hypothetical protein [Salmonella enterica subsp. enterica serovar Amager]